MASEYALRIIEGSDLPKLLGEIQLVPRENHFALVINGDTFEALPTEGRLIASAEVGKVIRLIRTAGINCFLEAKKNVR